MLKSRSRIVTLTLAIGALTVFGTGGALAADGAGNSQAPQPAATAAATNGTRANPPQQGDPPGVTHPLCEGGDALTGSPLCPSK